MVYRPNYQTLRDDRALAAAVLLEAIQPVAQEAEAAPQAAPDQAPAMEAEQVAEPTRPESVSSASPGWTGMGGMDQQQASANAYNNWVNPNVAARDQAIEQTVPSNAEQAVSPGESIATDQPWKRELGDGIADRPQQPAPTAVSETESLGMSM